MDKKTLTYITGFTVVIAVILIAYILSNLFIKNPQAPSQPAPSQIAAGEEGPKATPTFTFSPQEPASARVLTTPGATLPPGQAPKIAKMQRVEIKNSKFNPDTVTIEKGDVVTWTNNDTKTHKIIGKSWRSGQIQPGKAFSQQFDVAGTYQYFSEVEPSSTGTIIVQ